MSAGVFSLADFPQKQQECFSEDHYRFISVDSVGRERSKLFQVLVLILEAAITFFLFKLQRQQCASLERCICIDILADFLTDHLTFQVLERGLESEPVDGEILFGVGGTNEFQAIIGVHRLSSCTTGRDMERNDKVF